MEYGGWFLSGASVKFHISFLLQFERFCLYIEKQPLGE